MAQSEKPYLQKVPTEKVFRCANCKTEKTILTNHYTFCLIVCPDCEDRTVYGCTIQFPTETYCVPEAWLFVSIDFERRMIKRKCDDTNTIILKESEDIFFDVLKKRKGKK